MVIITKIQAFIGICYLWYTLLIKSNIKTQIKLISYLPPPAKVNSIIFQIENLPSFITNGNRGHFRTQ